MERWTDRQMAEAGTYLAGATDAAALFVETEGLSTPVLEALEFTAWTWAGAGIWAPLGSCAVPPKASSFILT